MPRMTKLRAIAPAALLLGAAIYACTSAPYTGRSQLVLVSESQEVQLGIDAYRQVLSKAVLVQEAPVLALVRRVGERVQAAADKPDYKWEFNVIDDDSMINAFALPGGKVAVYTGLFEVAQDEAGLAAVIGHEVGHALARHGAERMSQGQLAQIFGTGLALALGGQDPYAAEAVLQAFGLGVQLGVLLPYSRAQESEADHIGMILMAKAGYDPEAALHLWERMERANDKVPPEFLSTHPSAGTRQQDIKRWLPEAQRHYQPDPNRQIAKLPTLAELEASGDHGEAACKRYARTIDEKARAPQAARILQEALGKTLGIPAATVDRRQLDTRISLGEVAVASALAQAGAGSFDEVVAAYKQGKRWSAIAKDDDKVIREAIGSLRSALVEARALTRKYSRPRGR
ncbi:MAG: M48 family metallopeptidase [Deltaproteobacteria bacterium]|nr:M48 family metallopeptidase [Deltaproteobacteria bacterium]